MIDRDKTIEKFGYDPDILRPNSVKLIFRLCESCGKEQIVPFRTHAHLCGSCGQKGERSYWFGKQRSLETRKKMSESGKGKIHSKETKQKISKSNTGRKHTEETREKLSKINSGKNSNMYGRNGEKHPNWKGGRKVSIRKYRTKRREMLNPNPIELNRDFESSDGHHINKKYIINIPAELHRSIKHRQTDNKGMHDINKLAFKYLIDNKEDMIVSEETAFYINLMCL